MYKVAKNKTYKWPVEVRFPLDGGRFGKATFTAEFKLLPQDQIEKVVKAGRDGDETASICADALIGWGELEDESGQDIPYSDENKRLILNDPPALYAIVDAFFSSVNGSGAKRKN